MTQNVGLSACWLEILDKTIYEFHLLSEICAINEEYTGTNNVKPITFTGLDLGIYCTKNRNIFTCFETLEAIADRINFILHFSTHAYEGAKEIRARITTDLLNILTAICPDRVFKCPPTVYGSFENGLCCYESNINIHIDYDCDPNALWKSISKICISRVSRSQFSHERIEDDPAAGYDGEILLKMTHEPTAIETVISFTSEMRLNNAKLMKLYLNLNSNVKPLVLLLKHVLELQNLFGDDKISTYQLFWMVVYYLQRKKLLPAVRDARDFVDLPQCYVYNTWNYALPHPDSGNTLNESAASLFLGFVGFYKELDFLRCVISPYFGNSIRLEDIDAAIAGELENVKMPFIESVANYQDPTILNRNLFGSVSIKIINSFRHVCKYLYGYYYATIFQHNNFHITLPIVLPTRDPIDLIQCTSIILNVGYSSDLDRSIILAVRQLMENLLKFTLIKISKIKRNRYNLGTVIYFDYDIDSENCDTITSSILNLIIQCVSGNINNSDPIQIGNNQFKIYIVCIIKSDTVRLLIEGIACLIEFFNMLGLRLLDYIIKYRNRMKTAI